VQGGRRFAQEQGRQRPGGDARLAPFLVELQARLHAGTDDVGRPQRAHGVVLAGEDAEHLLDRHQAPRALLVGERRRPGGEQVDGGDRENPFCAACSKLPTGVGHQHHRPPVFVEGTMSAIRRRAAVEIVDDRQIACASSGVSATRLWLP
jgi:hypothetical protein